MKKVVLVVIVVLIIVLFGTGGFLFVKNLKKDTKLTNETIKILLKEYEKFDSDINLFASKREELYSMLDESYNENISKNVDIWNSLIDEYSKIVLDIKNDSKVLDKYCFNKFGSIEVNSKCTNYIANYEAAMNYYIFDIKSYNKNIVEKYNNWVDANEFKYKKLANGELTAYKDYIDYDKDKEYFGKDENDE